MKYDKRKIVFVVCLFLLFCVSVEHARGEYFCQNPVDISDGIKLNTSITKNGVSYTPESYYTNRTGTWGCNCNVTRCFKTCCNRGERLDISLNNISCIPSKIIANFYIIQVPPRQECSNITIQSIQIEDNGQWERFKFNFKNVCIADKKGELVAVVCNIDQQSKMYSTGMIISMPFLLATLLVHALLPEKNLHRKALMFYVLTLLIGYICLVFVKMVGQLSDTACTISGFFIVFFFLVSFFWMNVICFDIWLTFRGLKVVICSKTDSERKKFLLYCVYAWGVPLLFILVIFCTNYFGDLNSEYHPKIGFGSCFVGDGYPTLFYFYGPIAILLAANIILFIMTALKIRKIKKETSILKRSDAYDKNKQKFSLYVKLMFAMGINWSVEVISWAVIWKTGDKRLSKFWYVSDLCNALYGVFIFFLFVFKKKIWLLLKKRYYTFIDTLHLSHTTTTSQGT